MAANKNTKNLKLYPRYGGTVVDVGEMEIWDGADLALLRETLSRLILTDRCRCLLVNMTFVKYVPSGFFGMLYDWQEQGVRMRVLAPQPHVRQMLWFRKFFRPVEVDCYELQPDDVEVTTEPATLATLPEHAVIPPHRATTAW